MVLVALSFLEQPPQLPWLTLGFSAFTGFFITHLFRMLVQPWNWVRHSIPRMAIYTLISVGVLTFVLCGLRLYFEVIIGQTVFDPRLEAWYQYRHLLQYGFYISVTLGLWMFIYLTLHLFQAYSQIQIDRFRLENSLKSTKLQTLESQLNPHFLFNSLNSIAELIGEDPARSRHMVLRLSFLLRTTLKTGQRDLHPLEKEINLAKAYLEIESMRFEERLRYTFDVDTRFNHVQVPVMLILTLVENAIKHGIARQIHGGEVQVVVQQDMAQTLTVVVTNTGQLEDRETDSGTGLANIRERITLIYGDQAWLDIQNVKARKVRATVSLPISERS